jgi:hypothetical protein
MDKIKIMNRIIILIFIVFASCSTKEQQLTGEEILLKSSQKHDPKNQWDTAGFEVYIQEPRMKNPVRFSIVKLDNKVNSFSLQRNRDENISTHIVDAKGNTKTLLNNKAITDTTLIKKYRLDPSRNKGYQRFYKLLLGLPMSLNKNEIASYNSFELSRFNDKSAYKVAVELKEPMFSKNWNLYFSEEDFKILGVEMVFPEDTTKGERIVFDGEIKLNKMIIPRIRHWRELNNEYSGSDIILKKVN